MAKNFVKQRKHDSGRTITTKTAYGTDSSMIVTDPKIVSQVDLEDGFALCKDDEGYYVTKTSNIDNNFADPYRNWQPTRDKFIQTIVDPSGS
jgi:hypothetical protein